MALGQIDGRFRNIDSILNKGSSAYTFTATFPYPSLDLLQNHHCFRSHWHSIPSQSFSRSISAFSNDTIYTIHCKMALRIQRQETCKMYLSFHPMIATIRGQ